MTHQGDSGNLQCHFQRCGRRDRRPLSHASVHVQPKNLNGTANAQSKGKPLTSQGNTPQIMSRQQRWIPIQVLECPPTQDPKLSGPARTAPSFQQSSFPNDIAHLKHANSFAVVAYRAIRWCKYLPKGRGNSRWECVRIRGTNGLEFGLHTTGGGAVFVRNDEPSELLGQYVIGKATPSIPHNVDKL